MSKCGFDNEKRISRYLEGKTYSELNQNMKRFLRYINGNVNLNKDTLIKTKVIGGLYKTDLQIFFSGKTKNVSIKKGSGNSFHQEKIEFFVEFIKELGASQEVIKYIKKFIDSYEDGNVYFLNFPKEKQTIQEFFNKHTKDLLTRFLKTGRKNEKQAEFVYHGTISDGKFRDVDDVIEDMANSPQTGCAQLYVGALTFQKWNTRNEEKRGSIQLKGPKIKEFLE